MNIKNFSTVTGLFLGVFVVGVDSFIISPLLPQIAQDFHATISQTALGVTTYALCEMIGAPLFGPLDDRFSKRKLLITGMSQFALRLSRLAFECLFFGQIAPIISTSSFLFVSFWICPA